MIVLGRATDTEVGLSSEATVSDGIILHVTSSCSSWRTTIAPGPISTLGSSFLLLLLLLLLLIFGWRFLTSGTLPLDSDSEMMDVVSESSKGWMTARRRMDLLLLEAVDIIDRDEQMDMDPPPQVVVSTRSSAARSEDSLWERRLVLVLV